MNLSMNMVIMSHCLTTVKSNFSNFSKSPPLLQMWFDKNFRGSLVFCQKKNEFFGSFHVQFILIFALL